MCCRGVQLTNVFYSIWSTTTGSTLAVNQKNYRWVTVVGLHGPRVILSSLQKGFLITAMCCACVYFVFLTYMVIVAVRNMWDKRKKLVKFQEKTRKRYQVCPFYLKRFINLFSSHSCVSVGYHFPISIFVAYDTALCCFHHHRFHHHSGIFVTTLSSMNANCIIHKLFDLSCRLEKVASSGATKTELD